MSAKKIKKLPFVHLLLGPENGGKLSYLNELKTAVQHSFKDAELEVYKFYPYELNLAEIVALIQTPSLFGSAYFITFSNADAFKKSDLDTLLFALSGSQNQLSVVFLSDQYKLDKKLEDLCEASNKKIFWELRDQDRAQWVYKFFRNSGHIITKEAVARLLELLESNLQELTIAVEALSGFYPTSQSIDEEQIDYLIVHSREESVFSLFEQLCQKNLPSSLEILNKLALSTEGIGVQTISSLTWQFRKLVAVKEELNALKVSSISEALFRQFVIFGKKNQQTYQKAVGKYSLKELQFIILQCAQYDEILRSSLAKNLQHIALDSFILACCQQHPVLVPKDEVF